MRIKAIEVGRISLPLIRPFKTALRTVAAIEDVVVRVVSDDGIVGYGEAPPTAVITGDTTGSILCAIQDYIGPALIGMEIMELEPLMELINSSMVHNSSPKAAVDMAIYDLWAKTQGRPLYQLLGGARERLKTDLTISLNSVEQMVSDSLDALERGFDILKVKVGKGGREDLDRIAAIRQAVGPQVKLRVDANQGWTVDQSISIIGAMEDRGLDIELVEQPVPAHDLAGLKKISQGVDTPILADESVFSYHDAAKIIEEGAADLINIKLMKTGGIWNALKICRLAENAGIQCMMGCMLESRLAVAAAAHLAAGQKIITMTDLDGPSLCASDPYTGGPDFMGPEIVMTDCPGVGVENVPCHTWQ